MKFKNKTNEKIKVQKDVEIKFARSEWQTVRPNETIEATNAVFCKYYKKSGLTDISKEVPEEPKDEKPKEEKPEEKPEKKVKIPDDGSGVKVTETVEEKSKEPKKIRQKRKTTKKE